MWRSFFFVLFSSVLSIFLYQCKSSKLNNVVSFFKRTLLHCTIGPTMFNDNNLNYKQNERKNHKLQMITLKMVYIENCYLIKSNQIRMKWNAQKKQKRLTENSVERGIKEENTCWYDHFMLKWIRMVEIIYRF